MSAKFAIDIDIKRQAIRGWIDSANLSAVAKLYHRGALLATSCCYLNRPDVQAAGLHESGFCGFEFSNTDCDLIHGNIYKIVISADKDYSGYRVYGNVAELFKSFWSFELLPRSDLSFLDLAPEEIFRKECDIIAFKVFMIRLRRGKRGKGWRGGFKGHDYFYRNDDFLVFREMASEYLSVWLGFLDSRYLWSLVDTFADYGSREERLAALALSNYMYSERFFQTKKCAFNFVPKTNEEKEELFATQLGYWGGMATNKLLADDAVDVFLSRNYELLSVAPLIRRVFFELLRRSAREGESGFGFNLFNSQYFREAFEFYNDKI